MPRFVIPFQFQEDDTSQITGTLELEEPLPFIANNRGSGFYRPGILKVDGCVGLEVVTYHSPATAAFIYLRDQTVNAHQLRTIGLSEGEISNISALRLPGQLCLGSERTRIIGEAVYDLFGAPPLHSAVNDYQQDNLAIFPIAREGLKYQVAEAIFGNYGYFCDEIVLDAHHVFDLSVPVYNRKVELTLFKDKDLDRHQHENIRVAFIADSIASGLVMKEVIVKVKERFERLKQVEVLSPLATIRGLCRIAKSECVQKMRVRLHVFETLLNALPPDYYYSAHFNTPELHIRPDLEEEYRRWWGKDGDGKMVADTACAGYGWSEVFFSPRKQIQMINNELQTRHQMAIADIVRRNMAQEWSEPWLSKAHDDSP
jgi:hypothetical protein